MALDVVTGVLCLIAALSSFFTAIAALVGIHAQRGIIAFSSLVVFLVDSVWGLGLVGILQFTDGVPPAWAGMFLVVSTVLILRTFWKAIVNNEVIPGGD